MNGAGEGSLCAAKHVARELIEQQDARERTRRGGGPGVELTAQGLLDGDAETIGNCPVEVEVLLEPRLALRTELGTAFCAEPEIENALRLGEGARRIHVAPSRLGAI